MAEKNSRLCRVHLAVDKARPREAREGEVRDSIRTDYEVDWSDQPAGESRGGQHQRRQHDRALLRQREQGRRGRQRAARSAAPRRRPVHQERRGLRAVQLVGRA